MDQIISKLSEIEAASVRIIDGATADIQQLDEQLKQKIAAYDKTADQKIVDTLAERKKTLSSHTQEELKSLKQHTDIAIEQMVAAFHQHHEKLTDEIFNDLIRM